jgi:hypothetical protein
MIYKCIRNGSYQIQLYQEQILCKQTKVYTWKNALILIKVPKPKSSINERPSGAHNLNTVMPFN